MELQIQLSEDEFLPPESMTVEILAEDYDQFLDAEADVLHLTMRILASGTAVDRANAQLLAYQALKDRIPATYELQSEEIAFDVSEECAWTAGACCWTSPPRRRWSSRSIAVRSARLWPA